MKKKYLLKIFSFKKGDFRIELKLKEKDFFKKISNLNAGNNLITSLINLVNR